MYFVRVRGPLDYNAYIEKYFFLYNSTMKLKNNFKYFFAK